MILLPNECRLTLTQGVECVIQRGKFLKQGALYVCDDATLALVDTSVTITTPTLSMTLALSVEETQLLREFLEVEEDCNFTGLLHRSKALAASDTLWSSETRTLAEVATRAAITIDVVPYCIKRGNGCIDI